MQAIAAENNLAETAFLVPEGNDYRLRWFTPITEVPLCGHATLASAAVVMERLEPARSCVIFQSASGPLTVTKSKGNYIMDFSSAAIRAGFGTVRIGKSAGGRAN
jgi:PhzF family phenazine biosynthesis protein